MGRVRTQQRRAARRIASGIAWLPAPALPAGAFRGATEEEAFFVRCDETNNPALIADAGRLIAEIGVAPAGAARIHRPAAGARRRRHARPAGEISLWPINCFARSDFRSSFAKARDVESGSQSPDDSPSGAPLGDGAFQECSGLEVEMDVQEYQEGGRNDGVIRRVGRAKYSPVVLKRGMFFSAGGEVNRDLWGWIQGVVAGRRPVARYDGVIQVMSRARTSSPPGSSIAACRRKFAGRS